jgi:hypothetical protein
MRLCYRRSLADSGTARQIQRTPEGRNQLIESRLVEGSRRMREADQSMFALPSEENATASYSDGIEHTFLASSPVDLALYAPSCSSNTWHCQSR